MSGCFGPAPRAALGAAVATTETFTASDGSTLFVRHWEPSSGAPKAILHIHHGQSSHSLRFAAFAEKAVAKGYAVVAHDARGHGYTATLPGNPGLGIMVSGPDGVVPRMGQDYVELLAASHAKRPSLPIVLLGHSMGTIITRLVLTGYKVDVTHRPPISGVVLTGIPSSVDYASAGIFIGLVSALECAMGPTAISTIPQSLAFTSFQTRVIKMTCKPYPLSGWQWLNTIDSEVQKYIDDPLCGEHLMLGYWSSVLPITQLMGKSTIYGDLPENLPMAFFQGGDDGAATNDCGVHSADAVKDCVVDAGKMTPYTKIYPKCRHEILLEFNSEQVIQDVLNFLDGCCTAPVPPA
mmetsp:Transcript_20587/g.44811  ORF Transcript_20587/g.44811 Transcript_20587/m.44811 type:complete len:351 (+) Transcript_20587:132-1184(+)